MSNEIVAAHSLDEVGTQPDIGSAAATLRWMVIHMVEETARPVGHIDAIRELLDGAPGRPAAEPLGLPRPGGVGRTTTLG